MHSTEASLSPVSARCLRRWFCAAVLALAVFQFAENTADPDLWAHTLFGEHFLATGHLETVEPYSWTASGQPWINHEVLAEIAFGVAHHLAGGGGLLLLKIFVGLLTLLIALRLGGDALPWPQRTVVWLVAAVAVVEISFGFAARPQIFTALALVVEFWLLRKMFQGKILWALALPPLFALWINTHGGVIAGGVILFVAVMATTLEFFWRRPTTSLTPRILWAGWLAGAACAAALLVNPWGFGLVRWLVGSVLWLRPEIAEWNPAGVNWDHAALFALLTLAGIAFIFSRRQRVWWEFAVCAVLALLAFRSVRNTPLFSIAALAFVPPHLADLLARNRNHFARFEAVLAQKTARSVLTILFSLLTAGVFASTFFLHKEHPLTMAVPRDRYPVAAVAFMQKHALRGNLLAFFDWGEMCLWELPACPVSMDGRLDTCYSRELIHEHWHLYNDQPVNRAVLDIAKADVALLPVRLAGSLALVKKFGWQPVYFDDLAVVLVRDIRRFPQLIPDAVAEQGTAEAIKGCAPFPDRPSARLAP